MLQKVFQWAQGRHTTFAVYFALAGTVLQVFHKLDGNFIALITAVQGFVFAHSYQENKFAVQNPPAVPSGDKKQ
jgi:hypothetical protein